VRIILSTCRIEDAEKITNVQEAVDYLEKKLAAA
jgi:acyl carrier protein